ncbi:MAG: SRPBCC family protein [Sandaracinaceae bacterium]|nr:SRPBCC family protein [Sandaracinaceae bacterium]
MTRSFPLAGLLALAFAATAGAQPPAPPAPPTDALEAPLRPLSARDLDRLAPLMAVGVAAVVEHDMPPLLPAIHYALEVDAPARTVAELLSHPERFPALLPAIAEVTIEERRGDSVAYHWRIVSSVLTLGGRAMLTVYAPPDAAPARGWRIDVERTEGDLGRGREVWRVRPLGPDRSQLTLSTRVDLADANYVTRQMPQASRALSRTITMTTTLAMALRVQAEAERRAGRAPRALDGELRRPAVDVRTLEPLLLHADILAIEAAGDRFRQSTVITRYPRREAQVRSLIADPVAFSEALVQGSSATVTGQPAPDTIDFEWRYDSPIAGASGRMTLRERTDRVFELDATDGAMSGGRWRFETSRLPSGATAVVGWARFDVSEGNFLLRMICDLDPTFRIGLGASTEIMMSRALRIRIDRIPEADDHVPSWRAAAPPATAALAAPRVVPVIRVRDGLPRAPLPPRAADPEAASR